ncbi:sulfonate transport system substrate-binding protein [Enhydrobacter aerosaccus]|uniref:Putative aliphatic sulfonates-binding protein n=1 Tax=Enhydrobacter aerosaccus TaxID=225324 RepID=A0A1T4NUY5_9HYPH|nr:sulfonate ABC transporter substrate-binding protein [Enhydrobacter aerosaccus]SJZ83089.1 sulfonate transport system substrate-binding protein [Enhydrobacter aerosaccus]
MITRRHLLAAVPGALIAAPAIAQPAKAKELRFGYQRSGTLLIAKQQGVLEKRLNPLGVDVKWSEFSFGPPLLEALNVGSLDYGVTGDAPPIFAQAAKAKLLYVAAVEAGGSGSAILVPPGSTLQNLADLKGKRVGFARASSAHNLTIAALEKAGLSWNDIVPVQLAPADARTAFENGALDAWTIWDPYFAVAETRPGVRVLATAQGIAKQNAFFLGNSDYTRANPEVISAVNEELAKVATWAEANRDAVARVLVEATGIDLAVWQRSVARTEYRIAPLDEGVIEEQQRVADRFHKLGLIPNKIVVRDIVWKWEPRT